MGRPNDMLTMSRQWMHPKQERTKERNKEKFHRSTVTNHRARVPPVHLQQKEDARRRAAGRNGTIAAVAVARMEELPLAVGLGVRHLCCAPRRGQQWENLEK